MVHKGIYSAIKEKIQLKYTIEKILQLPLYKCMVNRPGVAKTVLKTDLAQQSTIAVKLGISNNQLLYLLTICFLFLRQVEKILPNAKTLQNLIQNDESCIIDGWQCGYVTDLAKWGKSIKSGSNTKTPLGS